MKELISLVFPIIFFISGLVCLSIGILLLTKMYPNYLEIGAFVLMGSGIVATVYGYVLIKSWYGANIKKP